MPPQTPMQPDRRGRAPMLNTPRGHLLLIALLVVTLVIGYVFRKANPIDPLPPASAYAQPYYGQLLNPMPDWGEPPADNYLHEHPMEKGTTGFKLPEYSGWYRFLGKHEGNVCVAAGQGLALCLYDSAYHCLKLETGQQLWEQPAPYYAYKPIVLFTPKVVLVYTNDTLVAYRKDDGKVLWQNESGVPIAWGRGIIWVIRIREKDILEEPADVDELIIIDAENGEELNSFPISSNRGFTAANYITPDYRRYNQKRTFSSENPASGIFSEGEAVTDAIALKDGLDIKVFRADGKIAIIPVALQGWPAAMAFTDKGLFIAEFESVFLSRYEYKLSEKLGLTDSRKLVARMIDLNTRKELWRYSDTIQLPQTSRDDSCFVSATHDAAVIRRANSAVVLDLETGNAASKPALLEHRLMPFILSYSGHCLVSGKGITGNPLSVYNLSTQREEQPFPLGMYRGSMAVSGDMLIASTYTFFGNDLALGINNHIFALKLDEKGRPLAGNLFAYGLPESNAKLVSDFYDNADPARNIGLMRRAVSVGVDALASISARSDRATPRQLDALISLTCYLKKMYPTDKSADTLAHYASAADEARLAERIILWLRDSSLTRIRKPLIALLARCDSKSARAYFDDVYEPVLEAKLNISKAPYKVPDYVMPGAERKKTYSSSTWGEYTSSDNTRYVAYTRYGLLGSYDIYLGIDMGSDGTFDVLLPTGLRDVSLLFDSINTYPDGKGAIKLRVEEGKVYLRYSEPIYRPYQTRESSEYDAPTTTAYDMAGKRRTSAELTLYALRLDSDNDGLTDICEKMLMLNCDLPDTDGDGMNDAEDPSPNVNNKTMGKLERGVQRALAYRNDLIPFTSSSSAKIYYEPVFDTKFYKFKGCSSVAMLLDDHTRCISLSTRSEIEAFYKSSADYSFYESWVEVYPVDEWYAKRIADKENRRSWGYTDPYERALPSGTKFVVELSTGIPSMAYPLCEVDGELYPAAEFNREMSFYRID